MNARKQLLHTLALAVILYGFIAPLGAKASIRIDAIVLGVCGNDVIEPLEQCDNAELGAASCTTLGYANGSLSCGSSCSFDISGCVAPETQTPTVTQGSGGMNEAASLSLVVLSGKAYPGGTITLYVDSTVYGTTSADASANFRMDISDVTPGIHNFGIHAMDSIGRSSILNYSILIFPNTSIVIGGIFSPPTLSLRTGTVQISEPIIASGQTVPNAEVSIIIDSYNSTVRRATSDAGGFWSVEIDASSLKPGIHRIQAWTLQDEDISPLSGIAEITITSGLLIVPFACNLRGDVNNDCRVNLIDLLSIAYWYRRPGTPPAKFDLVSDSVIDLSDFSILSYYWSE